MMETLSIKISKNEIKQITETKEEKILNPVDVINSWKNSFYLKTENSETEEKGLRNPQIGAIHATLAHWTCSDEIGTIVMPTGTGKTEAMLSILVKEQIERLLIIVPTDPLRTQISEKFATLGLLKEFGIVKKEALYPVVGILTTNFDTIENAKLFFNKCNVIVATASILSKLSDGVMLELKTACKCLFIDEAHHSEAKTWFKFRDQFKDKKILQFTATPYRNDTKKIGGKIIYSYPLRKAQEEGYFKKINFIRLHEYSSLIEVDKIIANKAVAQLKEDRKKYPHILLARVETTNRADEVYEIYKEFSDFKVVKIHSGVKAKEKREAKSLILEKKADIIICVDMLGEGFDLPELKIAAFHDVRKSLPITLQFIGRFTRTKYDEKLGIATIIANVGDLNVKNELDDLYSKDVDWNKILPDISEGKTQQEIDYYKFIEGFNDLENFPFTLQNLKPAQSTVIFKNHTQGWFPTNYKKGFKSIQDYDIIKHIINDEEKILVILTGKKEYVDWVNNDEMYNFTWHVYIVYWETENNLLFIHSSDNSSLHIDLAKAIIEDSAEIINGDNEGKIFRILSDIKRYKLQNVGLTQILGKLIRFVMRVGSDIEPALSSNEINKAKKAMIFGSGYENGNSISLGCSYKGRIWSRRTTNVEAFVKWCKKIGKKVMDDSLDAEAILRGTLVSKAISEIPKLFPILIDWNEEVYKQSETRYTFTIGNEKYDFYTVELELVNLSNTGNIKFALVNNEKSIAEFELNLIVNEAGFNDFKFIKTFPNEPVLISYGTKEEDLEFYFYKETPTIWFANGDSLEGSSYTELKTICPPYDKTKILEWDWTGINLSKESQGIDPKVTDSIQYNCISVLKNGDYDIIYDDDDSGEIADIITIKEYNDKIVIELYHLKYAVGGKVSKDMKNMYEVCGQVQKSVHWKFKDDKQLLEHLLRRDSMRTQVGKSTRFEKGTKDDVIRIIDLVKRRLKTEFKIFMVQPGISKSNISESQLELLGVTENYLIEKAMIQLQVIGSA